MNGSYQVDVVLMMHVKVVKVELMKCCLWCVDVVVVWRTEGREANAKLRRAKRRKLKLGHVTETLFRFEAAKTDENRSNKTWPSLTKGLSCFPQEEKSKKR